ncbi:MAG: elongation factor P [Candidatus Marinimicrobia bacterium]|jgi:elongation factor P|nr:elongation factor P [Candidatus Neomarinimicrobiota bacterium]MDP6592626.1 elongation factor P [Candidatus Neomarinimicrobiota bacterium]|tara:strand:+ start:568 stop:1128 length:561 start_codon:yes stop_codon:yes gene_type:complete
MATTANIRNGMVIDHKGQRMKIISFLHVKPGKGGAFVRTKLKNIITGQVIDTTFRAGEKIKPLRLDSKEMQYLYNEGESAIFMDLESFEQINVSHGMMIDELPFMKEGMSLAIDSIDDEIIGVKTPVFVELAVKKSDPGVRGNTATGGTKPVELETGHIATVPLFVDEGDVLKIDTRTGEYVERVK